MTTQATPNIIVTQTGSEDLYCFMLVISTDEGELTLRLHALEVVGLVHGLQVEILDWIGGASIAALEMLGQTEAVAELKKLREGS